MGERCKLPQRVQARLANDWSRHQRVNIIVVMQQQEDEDDVVVERRVMM